VPGKSAAGKPAAGKPVPGKSAAGKPVPGKPAARNLAAGKPAARNLAAGKPAARNPAAAKPAAAKPAAGNPAPETDAARTAQAPRPPSKESAAAERSPRSEAASPREPVWAPEPIVTPKVAALAGPVAGVVPPPIPNWDRASVSTLWPDPRLEHASQPTRPPNPVPSDAETHRPRSQRSRAFTTTVVLASLLVVFVAVTGVMILLHHSASGTGGTKNTAGVISPDTAKLQKATRAIDVDTSTARSALLSLHGIPTPGKVAIVMDPYVSSLQHFQTVLSGAKVQPAARSAAANVRASVFRNVQHLDDINGLAPVRLGSYLEEFGSGATQLQKDLGTLERDLRSATR
jgi:hypothetical protein